MRFFILLPELFLAPLTSFQGGRNVFPGLPKKISTHRITADCLRKLTELTVITFHTIQLL